METKLAPDLQILPWDSQFLGYNVGRIDLFSQDWLGNCVRDVISDTVPQPVSFFQDQTDLETVVANARQQAINLLYVFTDTKTVWSQKPTDTDTGSLVDTKVTYRYDLDQNDQYETEAAFGAIETFSARYDVAQLYELAYQSGEYSRFNVDPAFGEENFKRLYRQWIDNSLAGQAADATFVYVVDAVIRGFITVQQKQSVATIGLMATDRSVRGQGIGRALMNCVKRYARSTSATRLDVATQKNNTRACRFYEQNGFVVKCEVNVYHIWL